MNNLFKITVLGLLIVVVWQLFGVNNQLKQNLSQSELTKDQKYKLLTKVTTGIQVDYLKQHLGEPAFLKFSEDNKKKEYIFVDSDYYVQVVADSTDSIISYAITTRDVNFNPTLNIRGIMFQLGKTTFYSKDYNPTECFAFIGNTAPSHYFEVYTGWNGTTYRDYMLGYNDAGYGDRGIVEATQPTESDTDMTAFREAKNGCRMPSDEVRKKFTINTLLVSQGGFSSEFELGVNRREMELLNE